MFLFNFLLRHLDCIHVIMAGYNWTNDYLNLYSTMSHDKESMDQEDHSADLLEIRSMDYTETQPVPSTVSSKATGHLAEPNNAMMSNLDALTSLQGISTLLQRVNFADALPTSLPLPPSPWLSRSPTQHMDHQFFTVPPPSLPQPSIPRPRESYASVVQRPNPRDLWRSTLVQPTADFSVFNPCSKLPEVPQQIQQNIFDPDNAEIDDVYCVLCKRNGEQREWYTSHVLKDSRGKVVCPILRKYTCPTCGATGDNAHTIRHCPKSSHKQSK